jgi:hypothetical protein
LERLVAAAVAEFGALDYSSLIAAAERRLSTDDVCFCPPGGKDVRDESTHQSNLRG